MIKPDDKFIMYEYSYDQIERVESAAEDDQENKSMILTIHLTKSPLPPDTIKCFVFETPAAGEIASLIGAYHPPLASASASAGQQQQRRLHKITNADRLRLHENVVSARRLLVQNGVLKKSSGSSSANILRNTLRRLKNKNSASSSGVGGSGAVSSAMRKNSIIIGGAGGGAGSANSGGDFFADFPLEYFSFSKYPITSSLSYLDDGGASPQSSGGGSSGGDDSASTAIAVSVFQMLLNFAGVQGESRVY